ncbi:hypothetical protein [Actinomadura rubrisoli]|uniref:Uncharacterized protein n=1 Tax=Actinomadura rubrisoli TaxID=2530368 RepID=A0A4V2YZH4_9ACTN|nr:hypothetical protein [Actinomadura rubrisoli]TDD97217.1 hypothetical protein E1298_01920 [Actinomadura rubrisoli]
MSDFIDPFATEPEAPADPVPVDEPGDSKAPPSSEEPNRFFIKLTLKAGASYEAEWINPSVSGRTADEAAENAVAMIQALKRYGVIDLNSTAAQYTRDQFKGQAKSRSGGNGFQNSSPSRPEGQNSLPPGVQPMSCAHGQRVYRSGKGAKGEWAALMCPVDDRSSQCSPAWRQKDGSFLVR